MNQKNCFLILAVLFLSQGLYGQRMKSMDFRNQQITDILMALAEISGTSIIADETVGGAASFHFTDSEFEDSLEIFLSSYNLFYTRDGNTFRVSRIQGTLDESTGLVTMRARDVAVENLIRTLAKIWNTTILHDPLPRINLSVDIDGLDPTRVLDILIQRLEEFTLEKKDAYYYIRHTGAGAVRISASFARGINRDGDTYSLSLESARFLELLPELFKKAEREYAVLTKTDTTLENLYYTGKDFDTLLRIILEQGNADYAIHNNIYYIVELQRRDVIKKFRETRIIPLSYIQAQELPALLPADMGTGNNIKIDKKTNTAIVTGTLEEIKPVITFIERVDRPGENYPITLKYIKTDELIKTLPPSVIKEELADSGFPNLVFYTGPKEKRELFLKDLTIIDRPKPQIRYELLVIEYMKNKEARISRGLQVSPAGEDSSTSFLGNLSNVMNLSFDVVAQFGYQFATNLSVQLGDNTAEVYANTTLNGLSGQEIKFQNTDTYRYQEFEVDADTGNISRTGVTREITSGLIVALNGWISGDDMITISVNATVSKQNNNASNDSTALPTTSERVVNTQIRTPSGKPVVLSGLMKEDINKNIKKIPLLGDIPFLGRLFRDQTDTKEKTEIVIYIVPYLSRDTTYEEQDSSLRMERYYHDLVEGYLK
ncbi:secretin N-terminal domain-containing protein [Treponema primitia]|uniref:secretin N-terminal domain-containing protein n=1 Tax=Treponema primitia TaxID=88058 RepID=UPI00025555BC|nr:secretin N-terminal domain-containing protein [Treponema primitia]